MPSGDYVNVGGNYVPRSVAQAANVRSVNIPSSPSPSSSSSRSSQPSSSPSSTSSSSSSSSSSGSSYNPLASAQISARQITSQTPRTTGQNSNVLNQSQAFGTSGNFDFSKTITQTQPTPITQSVVNTQTSSAKASSSYNPSSALEASKISAKQITSETPRTTSSDTNFIVNDYGKYNPTNAGNAKDIATGTAAYLNYKLGGAEYVTVTPSNQGYILQQNPKITAQSGIDEAIKNSLVGFRQSYPNADLYDLGSGRYLVKPTGQTTQTLNQGVTGNRGGGSSSSIGLTPSSNINNYESQGFKVIGGRSEQTLSGQGAERLLFVGTPTTSTYSDAIASSNFGNVNATQIRALSTATPISGQSLTGGGIGLSFQQKYAPEEGKGIDILNIGREVNPLLNPTVGLTNYLVSGSLAPQRDYSQVYNIFSDKPSKQLVSASKTSFETVNQGNLDLGGRLAYNIGSNVQKQESFLAGLKDYASQPSSGVFEPVFKVGVGLGAGIGELGLATEKFGTVPYLLGAKGLSAGQSLLTGKPTSEDTERAFSSLASSAGSGVTKLVEYAPALATAEIGGALAPAIKAIPLLSTGIKGAFTFGSFEAGREAFANEAISPVRILSAAGTGLFAAPVIDFSASKFGEAYTKYQIGKEGAVKVDITGLTNVATKIKPDVTRVQTYADGAKVSTPLGQFSLKDIRGTSEFLDNADKSSFYGGEIKATLDIKGKQQPLSTSFEGINRMKEVKINPDLSKDQGLGLTNINSINPTKRGFEYLKPKTQLESLEDTYAIAGGGNLKNILPHIEGINDLTEISSRESISSNVANTNKMYSIEGTYLLESLEDTYAIAGDGNLKNILPHIEGINDLTEISSRKSISSNVANTNKMYSTKGTYSSDTSGGKISGYSLEAFRKGTGQGETSYFVFDKATNKFGKQQFERGSNTGEEYILMNTPSGNYFKELASRSEFNIIGEEAKGAGLKVEVGRAKANMLGLDIVGSDYGKTLDLSFKSSFEPQTGLFGSNKISSEYSLSKEYITPEAKPTGIRSEVRGNILAPTKEVSNNLLLSGTEEKAYTDFGKAFKFEEPSLLNPSFKGKGEFISTTGKNLKSKTMFEYSGESLKISDKFQKVQNLEITSSSKGGTSQILKTKTLETNKPLVLQPTQAILQKAVQKSLTQNAGFLAQPLSKGGTSQILKTKTLETNKPLVLQPTQAILQKAVQKSLTQNAGFLAQPLSKSLGSLGKTFTMTSTRPITSTTQSTITKLNSLITSKTSNQTRSSLISYPRQISNQDLISKQSLRLEPVTISGQPQKISQYQLTDTSSIQKLINKPVGAQTGREIQKVTDIKVTREIPVTKVTTKTISDQITNKITSIRQPTITTQRTDFIHSNPPPPPIIITPVPTFRFPSFNTKDLSGSPRSIFSGFGSGSRSDKTSIYADLLSVGQSLRKYGKATSPSLYRKANRNLGRRALDRIPTAEQLNQKSFIGKSRKRS